MTAETETKLERYNDKGTVNIQIQPKIYQHKQPNN